MALRLSHHQHVRLVRLLECELTGAWLAALGAGADPRALGASLNRRRMLIEARAVGGPDDRPDPQPGGD